MTRKIKVLIMAGGTGGHVFPALATAKELQKHHCDVEWLGTALGIEAQLIPAQQIPLHYLYIAGVRGKGIITLLKAPWRIAMAIAQARRLLREVAPNVVLGMGGYVSGPGGVAAKLLGIPLVIHEQNARPGTTNKWLAKIADRVLTAFPDVFRGARCIGNPIREEIVNIPPPLERLRDRVGPIRLLVLGGSLGAQAINELVPTSLAEIAGIRQFLVIHQTGKRHYDATRERYSELGVDGTVKAFIDDMAEVLTWADIVICRAGALTVSELSAAGVASILIPFPFAIDDHQTANANWLVALGAAELRQQAQLTVKNLKELLLELSGDRKKMLIMAEAARRAAKPEATKICAEMCMEVARA